MSSRIPQTTNGRSTSEPSRALAIVGAACGVIGALAAALGCVAAFTEVSELRRQATESQELAQKGYDLASNVQEAQAAADERTYAQNVNLWTDHRAAADGTDSVRVTIRNYNRTTSITDIRLETPGASGQRSSIVRLTSIIECREARFSIPADWWQRNTSFVVFRDVDGRYWKRVEAAPVEAAAPVKNQKVFRDVLVDRKRVKRSNGVQQLKPDKGVADEISRC